MNGFGPNEIEERRVMRLLGDAAAEVAPLPEHDVDSILRAATGGVPRAVRRRRPLARHLHHAVAACAAAAVVISSSLALTSSEPQEAANRSGPTDVRLASFPEGSALRLLLSIQANGGNS
jgi:ferric-dicitrate binding protein FerR (iron transport regulator)